MAKTLTCDVCQTTENMTVASDWAHLDLAAVVHLPKPDVTRPPEDTFRDRMIGGLKYPVDLCSVECVEKWVGNSWWKHLKSQAGE